MAIINGTPGDDRFENALVGTDGDDIISGFEGRDEIIGNAGDDTLDGGAGDRDYANYTTSPGSITGNLTTGVVSDGFGGTDTLINIEEIRGSDFNDTLTGGESGEISLYGRGGDDILIGNNTSDEGGTALNGGDGNDTLTSIGGDYSFMEPGSGDDTIIGSTSFDIISYFYSAGYDDPPATQGVTVTFTEVGGGTAIDYRGDTDTFTGIERVEGTMFADTFIGAAGFQSFSGTGGNDTINGGDGEDEVSYDGSHDDFAPESGVIVDLEVGTATDKFGDTDTLISIERVRGSDFGDQIKGDEQDNFLRGEDGDDLLLGGEGDDGLFGGRGNDTLEGGDGRDDLWGGEGDDTLDGGAGDRDEARYDNDNNGSGITGNLTTGTVTDEWGDTDTLIGIEWVTGSNSDDVLFGGTGFQSQLRGRGGDDSLTGADDDFETGLFGGVGNDTLDAGTGGGWMAPGSGDDQMTGGTEAEGFYTIEYIWDAFDEGASSGITVVFSSERDGTITDFAGDTDTFTGVDRVQGTMFADSFTGTDGDQDFRGYGGDDFFDGGAGTRDRIDYSRPEDEFGTIGGVTVDMVAGTATDAYGDTDTFTNIERIRGTDFDDNITGDDNRNELDGRDGSDILNGGAGDDVLAGMAGDDAIDGGDGVDTAIYSGDQKSYTLTLTPIGTMLEDRRADGNGIDSLTDVEFLDFDADIFDGAFNLQQFGGPTGLSQSDFKSFIELYIAYFNRAPDAVGLNFWGTAFATGTTLEEMATLFVDQDETRATYPEGTSNLDFATSVYSNVLGRIPDQLGLDFWVGVLDQGGVTRDQFILEVLRGAKADLRPDLGQDFVDQQLADKAYLDAKIDVGAYFAVHKGMSDVENAQAVMELFDGSGASVDAAIAAADEFYQAALDPLEGEFLMKVVGVLDDPFTM